MSMKKRGPHPKRRRLMKVKYVIRPLASGDHRRRLKPCGYVVKSPLKWAGKSAH